MRKGTHKIKIWKPRFRKVDAENPDNGGSATDADGTTTKAALSGFMLVPVVDVSQLQGDPQANRPAPPRPIELSGDAPAGLWGGVAAQITAHGFTVERGDCGGAYGSTVWAERQVSVRADVEPAQAAKTLTHELAHILCEHEARSGRRGSGRRTGGQTASTPRHLLEVEAESVACIVTAVCGLDTLAYSVPYVAGWAADRDTARKSAERVLAVADAILAQLDQAPRRLDVVDVSTHVTDAPGPELLSVVA